MVFHSVFYPQFNVSHRLQLVPTEDKRWHWFLWKLYPRNWTCVFWKNLALPSCLLGISCSFCSSGVSYGFLCRLLGSLHLSYSSSPSASTGLHGHICLWLLPHPIHRLCSPLSSLLVSCRAWPCYSAYLSNCCGCWCECKSTVATMSYSDWKSEFCYFGIRDASFSYSFLKALSRFVTQGRSLISWWCPSRLPRIPSHLGRKQLPPVAQLCHSLFWEITPWIHLVQNLAWFETLPV